MRRLRDKIRSGLAKTRQSLASKIEAVVSRASRVDDDLMDELEEALLSADVGLDAAEEILDRVRERAGGSEPGAVRDVLREELVAALSLEQADGGGPEGPPPETGPEVILVVGVNGAGKTTTVGKLAWRFRKEGKKVMVAAADTFRAAATEQLEQWVERAGGEIVRQERGADPAAVAFDALQAARARGCDCLIVDTAGRLHTKANLMEELRKIRRVLGRQAPGAPHRVLLVLDATAGQNALVQAREFGEATGVTGIVVAKLDGTARGGAVVAIARTLKVPVQMLGVGEGPEDLVDFDPREFAEALVAY